MARLTAITDKPKKVKASKVVGHIVNSKHMGDEPVFPSNQVLSVDQYAKAMYWYNTMRTKAVS